MFNTTINNKDIILFFIFTCKVLHCVFNALSKWRLVSYTRSPHTHLLRAFDAAVPREGDTGAMLWVVTRCQQEKAEGIENLVAFVW